VNPFGLAWDARGNLYSSDCHSAPLYQLLTGGWYPSFGKPHDGLGFAPVMLEHAHGSTAIDGAVYYNDNLWPAEYRDTLFIGNVMTSRLNRDTITFNGSTPKATEQPDFLTTTDPWFRPVDATLGPDGALYIADFYNRIIAHVEVPLSHPGRDRSSGRIWRVVRKATDGRPILRRYTDFRNVAPAEQVQRLADPSFAHRLVVLNHFCDLKDLDASIEGTLRTALTTRSAPVSLRVGALWILERRNLLRPTELAAAAKALADAVQASVEKRAVVTAKQAEVDAAGRQLDALQGIQG
jgi:hypothetical protein